MNVSLGHSILGVLLSSQDCSSARLWMADAIHRGCPQDSAWGLLCAHPWPAAAFRWSGYGSNFGDARKTREVIEHFMYCKSSVWPGRETQDINFSAPSGTASRKVGKLALRRILPWVITPNNLPNSCCPRWVWRSCMAGRIVAAVTRCTA